MSALKCTPGIKAERGNVADRHPLFLTAPGKAGLLPWCDEDAQLFAAAPDLYAALESIQWGNDEIGFEGEVYHLCPECDRSEVRGHQADCSVGNALAKAEGAA